MPKQAQVLRNPFLDEQGIDPTADEARVNAAVAANIAFEKAEKDSEEFSEQRDNLFTPVFKDHMGCVQFLKKLFRNNVSKLGEWGQTVDSEDRVVYPPDFIGRTTVAKALITKHASFPVGTSPLLPYLTENTINLTTNGTDINSAITAHNNFLVHNATKEEKREARDVLMAPIEEHLRGIGQFLVGLFNKTPHKAGQWGFIIDDSARPHRKALRRFPFRESKPCAMLTLAHCLPTTDRKALPFYPAPEKKEEACWYCRVKSC